MTSDLVGKMTIMQINTDIIIHYVRCYEGKVECAVKWGVERIGELEKGL